MIDRREALYLADAIHRTRAQRAEGRRVLRNLLGALAFFAMAYGFIWFAFILGD